MTPAQAKTRPAPGTKQILLVDDHPVMAQGLAQLLNHEPGLHVCALAGTAAKALDLAGKLKPDLALVDISLPGANGLELIKQLQACRPGLPVLVLSMHDEALYAERALRAGARGYVMKQEPSEVVIAAIHRVLAGELHMSEAMRSRLVNRLFDSAAARTGPDIARLSDRELEVFQLIGQGRGTREIAVALHLSIKTVETHRARLKQKLHARTGPELVQQAVAWVQQQQPQARGAE